MGKEASRVNAINPSKCEIFVCLHMYIHCRQKKQSRPIGVKSALCCGILNSKEKPTLAATQTLLVPASGFQKYCYFSENGGDIVSSTSKTILNGFSSRSKSKCSVAELPLQLELRVLSSSLWILVSTATRLTSSLTK